MELKLAPCVGAVASRYSFNRTSMELKLFKELSEKSDSHLLIEPVWN